MKKFRGKTLICILLAIVCISFAVTAESASYRLFGDYMGSVGNQWVYQLHITKTDGQPVNWNGTSSWEITHTENIAGYDTVRGEWTHVIDDVGTFTSRENTYSTSDYNMLVRDEDDDILQIVRNENPLEDFPVLVSDDDSNRHVGHGDFNYTTKQPPIETFTGYEDTYITFLQLQTITVPAGTFDCIKVLHRTKVYLENIFWRDEQTWLWVYPGIGIIKMELQDQRFDFDDNKWVMNELSMELTSTNVRPSTAMPWISLLLLQESTNEQHEFGSAGFNFCFCGPGGDKSWDSTAINTFNVKYIEVRSELAEPTACPAGGTHYVTIKVNDSDVFSCPGQYVDHTFYSYYTCAGDVDFTLNQGDTITYYFTYTDTACIGGPNYVNFADAVP